MNILAQLDTILARMVGPHTAALDWACWEFLSDHGAVLRTIVEAKAPFMPRVAVFDGFNVDAIHRLLNIQTRPMGDVDPRYAMILQIGPYEVRAGDVVLALPGHFTVVRPHGVYELLVSAWHSERTIAELRQELADAELRERNALDQLRESNL